MTNKIKYELTHSYASDSSKYNVKFETVLTEEDVKGIVAHVYDLLNDIDTPIPQLVGGIEIALLIKSFYDDEMKFLDMNEDVDTVIDEVTVNVDTVKKESSSKDEMIVVIQHLLNNQYTLIKG